MKILAFGASNSSDSINKKLATYASSLFVNEEVEVIDLIDFTMPLFSKDKENENGHPQEAFAFLKKIEESDFLIISLAENNGNFNVGFKNIFDWCSRINGKVFQDKPMLLMATSPGKRGGANVLAIAQKSFPFYGGNIKAVFSLPMFHDFFDSEKFTIKNEELNYKLATIVQSLKTTI